MLSVRISCPSPCIHPLDLGSLFRCIFQLADHRPSHRSTLSTSDLIELPFPYCLGGLRNPRKPRTSAAALPAGVLTEDLYNTSLEPAASPAC